jgi:hypothetical protein
MQAKIVAFIAYLMTSLGINPNAWITGMSGYRQCSEAGGRQVPTKSPLLRIVQPDPMTPKVW